MKTTFNQLMNEIDDFYRNIEECSFIPKEKYPLDSLLTGCMKNRKYESQRHA